jgi:hypothetical protein
MTEPQEQCCGTCWWFHCRPMGLGCCCRDGSTMLASEGCSRWEKEFHYGDEDPPDHEEEDDHGP